MRFTSLASVVVAVLPGLTGAVEWWLIDGQCDTGWGGPAGGIPFYPSVRVGDSACASHVCGWNKADTTWHGPSPCNNHGSCAGGVRYQYVPNGSGLNINRVGSSNIIGHCTRGNQQWISCTSGAASCGGIQAYACSTDEC